MNQHVIDRKSDLDAEFQRILSVVKEEYLPEKNTISATERILYER